MKTKFLMILLLLAFLISSFIIKGDSSEDSKPARSSENPGNSITNLYDSFGEKIEGLTMDFGFSALVKFGDKLILFDAGTNADILKQNVETLGIDLSEVDFAVASHVHGDHINGFDYLLSVNPYVKIYMPSDFFAGAPIHFSVEGKEKEVVDSLPEKMRYFSWDKLEFDIIQSGRYWNADVEYVSENLEIEPGINLVFTR